MATRLQQDRFRTFIDLVDAPMVRAYTDHVRLAQGPAQVASLDGTIAQLENEYEDVSRSSADARRPSAAGVCSLGRAQTRRQPSGPPSGRTAGSAGPRPPALRHRSS